MGVKYGAATSLRSCCVVLGDQDGWGTNRLSKAESILGTGMSQNLSRGRRHACKERTWRHLDTMQFATYLHCNVPRVRCEKHDVKSIRVPWAEKNSRFTLLFEAFAIRVLNAARSVEEARKLLGLNWHQVDAIKARAVKRGLARRQATKIDCLGIDEKQFRRCQPWRAKRRLVDPSSREAALFSRRALRQRENKVGLRTRRPVIGSQVRSSNELAKLLRSAG